MRVVGVAKMFDITTRCFRRETAHFREVLSGDVPPEPSGEEDLAGCFIHAWSATIYLYTIVRGFLGITPHASESVTIGPYLARDWNISVKRLAVGESLLSFELRWDGTDIVATVRNEGNVIDVDFGIVVPAIADCLSATIKRRQS